MRNRYRLFVLFWLTIQLFSGYLLSGQNLSPADIIEKYGKAVVVIMGIRNGEKVAIGSGFIVSKEGAIVTNYHVIKVAYPAVVKTSNGDVYDDISVIDFDDRRDFAIIKIAGFDLPVVDLGNSDNVRIGERVIVIGNPQGYENSISDGLLSQIRDTGEGYFLHQISAPISPGSSGSPVFNQKGQVIGIATLSFIEAQNLNFSVPINYMRGTIDLPAKYSLKDFSLIYGDPPAMSKEVKANPYEPNTGGGKVWPPINYVATGMVLNLTTEWQNNHLTIKLAITNPPRKGANRYSLHFYNSVYRVVYEVVLYSYEYAGEVERFDGTWPCPVETYKQFAGWDVTFKLL